MYLTKTQTIAPESLHYIELLSEKSESFRPTHIQILVNSLNNLNDFSSYVEICNISVMGDPQFINYDGVTNIRSRGNSLTFKKILPIDFSTFGASAGQGLSISVFNPHLKEVEVNILLKGNPGSSDNLGERGELSRRYLFNHFKLDHGINNIPLNNITRSGSGKFKCSELQLLSFKTNSNDSLNPIIRNIMVAGESQFENLEDIKLNSIFFEELREFEMKELHFHGKGTYITLENPYDYELNCYMTMVSKKILVD